LRLRFPFQPAFRPKVSSPTNEFHLVLDFSLVGQGGRASLLVAIAFNIRVAIFPPRADAQHL